MMVTEGQMHCNDWVFDFCWQFKEQHDLLQAISVHPANDTCIDIRHQEEGGDLRVYGSPLDPQDLPHPPGRGLRPDQRRVSPDDHHIS